MDDSGRTGRRGAKRRVAERRRDLGAALDERCGAEGWRRPSRRAPRSGGARRRRPVRGTPLLRIGAGAPGVGTDPGAGPARRGVPRKTRLWPRRRARRRAPRRVRAARPRPSGAARFGSAGLAGVRGGLPAPRTGARGTRDDRRLASTGARPENVSFSKFLYSISTSVRYGSETVPRAERMPSAWPEKFDAGAGGRRQAARRPSVAARRRPRRRRAGDVVRGGEGGLDGTSGRRSVRRRRGTYEFEAPEPRPDLWWLTAFVEPADNTDSSDVDCVVLCDGNCSQILTTLYN